MMSAAGARRDAVIKFWYASMFEHGFNKKGMDNAMRLWYGFGLSPEEKVALDEEIKDKFEEDVVKLKNGEYDDWKDSAEGVTAICVLGDQMTRNIYRKSGKAFELDPKVQGVVTQALDRGMHKDQNYIILSNWLLPYMHAEDLSLHERARKLHLEKIQEFEANGDKDMKNQAEFILGFLDKHTEMIKKFGRYPYRNAVLGRKNTPEEDDYLNGEHDSFGQ